MLAMMFSVMIINSANSSPLEYIGNSIDGIVYVCEKEEYIVDIMKKAKYGPENISSLLKKYECEEVYINSNIEVISYVELSPPLYSEYEVWVHAIVNKNRQIIFGLVY